MISFSRISKQYGRQVLFVDASFQLNPGEKVGLVGPNGAGKTTLFRMIVGEEAPDDGDVSVPKKLTIGYFRQDVEEMSGRSVLDEAIAGSGRVGDLHHELEALHAAMADPARADDMDRILARFGEVQEEYEHLGGYALESQAREVLHGLGFDDERIDGDVGALSGGWKMRVAMARVLLGRPDVLLMDEPTNHLDIESIIWLEDFLKSHDRRAAHDVARPRLHEPHRLEDRGDRRRRDHRLLRQLRLLRARARDPRDEPRGGLRAPAGDAREGAAVHRALRGARRQGRAGAEPRQGARQDREDRAAEEAPRRRSSTSASRRARATRWPSSRTCTRRTARARIYDGLNLTIRRGERWCVMGRNGAGKTTLLKMVAGALAPDAGEVRLGASLKMGYFAQQALDLLDPDLTIFEQIQKDFPHESMGVLRSLLGAFQFSGDDVDKKIRALSGGEKTRLVMARMLLDPPNFLVLDEPTNHLDLATKEMLVDGAEGLRGHDAVRVARPDVPARPEQPRARAGRRKRHRRAAARLSRLVRRVRRAHRARSAGRAHVSRLLAALGVSR